ncbi:MAG: hypothetical protein Q7R57_07445 [Dehalococcoidales bacterium]|nr:hypothetical protein [Dehalococcoidales bacterium]
MAKTNEESKPGNPEKSADINELKRHLDMLDQRLDNMDSMLSVVAERVLKQSLTVNITCPSCGRNIEIALIGTEKPRR